MLFKKLTRNAIVSNTNDSKLVKLTNDQMKSVKGGGNIIGNIGNNYTC